MGTKQTPGRYDCHAAAAVDEPLFTLLARDPIAPYLVSLWAEIRLGHSRSALLLAEAAINRLAPRYAVNPETEKANEARACSAEMRDWCAGASAHAVESADAG